KLTAKQDGKALIGTLSGDGIEYYRHPKGRKGRRKNSVFNRLIPAKPLHKESVRLLAEVLLDQNELRQRLTDFVIEHRRSAQREAVNMLIPSLSVDMETKEVELTIALPVWATAAKPKPRKRPKKAKNEVCPTTTSWSQAGCWTQVVMARARCEYHWVRGSHTVP